MLQFWLLIKIISIALFEILEFKIHEIVSIKDRNWIIVHKLKLVTLSIKKKKNWPIKFYSLEKNYPLFPTGNLIAEK